MDLLSKIKNYIDEGRDFALATVVESSGSTPQIAGAKMIIFSDGSIEGTVGGGKVEHATIKDALYFIRDKKAGLQEYILTKKYNSLCGGKMKVFIETFKPQKKLIIFGAGHIGLALCKLAGVLNFKVTVIDERRSFANKVRLPMAEKIFVCVPKKTKNKVNVDSNSYIVIVTHQHKRDYEALKTVIDSGAKYIGMIGSRSKVKNVFDRLVAEGIDKKVLSGVCAPVGLNLGGSSPEEIALSILSEIICAANNTKGFLRFTKVI